jgi:hypothetical protein
MEKLRWEEEKAEKAAQCAAQVQSMHLQAQQCNAQNQQTASVMMVMTKMGEVMTVVIEKMKSM